MHLHENILRLALTTNGGSSRGYHILAAIAKGERLIMTMENGDSRKFADVSDAMNQLRDLGWRASPPKKDVEAVA